MSIFGKKALSLDEILKGIENLSEEEQETLRLKMQKTESTEEERTSDEETSDEQSENSNEENVEETESPAENESEEPIEQTEENDGEGTEAMAESPMESPSSDSEEEKTGGNYDELIVAQNARIDSLESQLSAMRETLEKVVSNQENQNFGYSPKANFDDEVSSSRMDSVLNGYAPRRANQYK